MAANSSITGLEQFNVRLESALVRRVKVAALERGQRFDHFCRDALLACLERLGGGQVKEAAAEVSREAE